MKYCMKEIDLKIVLCQIKLINYSKLTENLCKKIGKNELSKKGFNDLGIKIIFFGPSYFCQFLIFNFQFSVFN